MFARVISCVVLNVVQVLPVLVDVLPFGFDVLLIGGDLGLIGRFVLRIDLHVLASVLHVRAVLANRLPVVADVDTIAVCLLPIRANFVAILLGRLSARIAWHCGTHRWRFGSGG